MLHLRHLDLLFGVFVFGYLPVAGTISVTEGALRGLWDFSFADFTYQMGAFAVYYVPSLLIGGLAAVPTAYWLLGRKLKRAGPIHGAVLFPVILLLSVELGAGTLGLLTEGAWLSVAWMMLYFPSGLVGAAALFGGAIGKLAPFRPYPSGAAAAA
jgi:hypothetical protein